MTRSFWLMSAVLLTAGCGNSGSGAAANASQCTAAVEAPAGATEFIAYACAFYDFRTWDSVVALGPDGSTDGIREPDGGADIVHTTLPLTAYISKKPATGSTEFPVGTVIVKEVSSGDLASRQVFAMVKRGGDFNATGATNWEWFGLTNVDSQNVLIQWRGFGPVNVAESYGGDPQACNGCHSEAKANDFVFTTGLQLSSF